MLTWLASWRSGRRRGARRGLKDPWLDHVCQVQGPVTLLSSFLAFLIHAGQLELIVHPVPIVVVGFLAAVKIAISLRQANSQGVAIQNFNDNASQSGDLGLPVGGFGEQPLLPCEDHPGQGLAGVESRQG